MVTAVAKVIAINKTIATKGERLFIIVLCKMA